ncbi:MAG TPA: hypothetical protein VFW19_15690 [Allosphingosinicella sp.]|nr:hypothetical protein [Allosphingosinicella sp.]
MHFVRSPSPAKAGEDNSRLPSRRWWKVLACRPKLPPMGNDLRRVVLALALVSGFAGTAGARPAAEAILVRFRFPYAVCAGVCPNFEMKISPRGDVVTRSFFGHAVYRFRATPARLEAFRQALDPLRPAGKKRLDDKCGARQEDGTPDPLAVDPRPDDFELDWTGGRSEARLTGCAFGHWPIRKAVYDALRALGANPFFGWDQRFDPCGPGSHPEPAEDAARPEADGAAAGLSASVCRP